MEEKKPFKQKTNLDSVTVTCPCGASITGEGDSITQFQILHKEHTNGKVKCWISDDGMRILSEESYREYEYNVD